MHARAGFGLAEQPAPAVGIAGTRVDRRTRFAIGYAIGGGVAKSRLPVVGIVVAAAPAATTRGDRCGKERQAEPELMDLEHWSNSPQQPSACATDAMLHDSGRVVKSRNPCGFDRAQATAGKNTPATRSFGRSTGATFGSDRSLRQPHEQVVPTDGLL